MINRSAGDLATQKKSDAGSSGTGNLLHFLNQEPTGMPANVKYVLVAYEFGHGRTLMNNGAAMVCSERNYLPQYRTTIYHISILQSTGWCMLRSGFRSAFLSART
jgi:hypothetical protein